MAELAALRAMEPVPVTHPEQLRRIVTASLARDRTEDRSSPWWFEARMLWNHPTWVAASTWAARWLPATENDGVLAAAAAALCHDGDLRMAASEALHVGAKVGTAYAGRDRRWGRRWGSGRRPEFWMFVSSPLPLAVADRPSVVPALPGMAEMLSATTRWPAGPWIGAVEAAQEHIVERRAAGRAVPELDGSARATLDGRLSKVVAVDGLARSGREALVRIVVGHPGVEGLWGRWRAWAAECVTAGQVLDFPAVPGEVRRSWRGQLVRSDARYEGASAAERHAMRRREWEGRDDPLRWRPAA